MLNRIQYAALTTLCPNGVFEVTGEEYILDGKVDESQPAVKPTLDEINTWVQQNRASLATQELREQRNKLLEESDKMYQPDRPGATAWATYRQALRDLPDSVTPEVDDNLRLTNVTWPTKPE